MALQADDIIVVQRPSTKALYHCKVEDFQSSVLPDGDDENYMLIWNGSSWVPGTLDGGLYEGSDINTIDGGTYNPEVIVDGPDYDSGTYDPNVPGIGDDIDGSTYSQLKSTQVYLVE